MGTKLRQMRVDDDVWEAIQALRAEYGTVNAGLRARFGLNGKVVTRTVVREGVEREEEVDDL